MSLPPFRRIVTGHTPEGNAIFKSDQELTPADPFPAGSLPEGVKSISLATIFRSKGYPAEANEPFEDLYGKQIGLSHPVGTTVRVVDFPPNSPEGLMHRTITIDFGIVLSGEIELELDGGVTKVMKQHDVIVQRGTIHSWNNKGTEPVRIMFVLIPSNPIKVGEKELEATELPPPLLEPVEEK